MMPHLPFHLPKAIGSILPGFGKQWTTVEKYARKFPVRTYNAYGEVERKFTVPVFWGDRIPDLFSRLLLPVPSLGVSEIQDGSVFRDGWIIGVNNKIIIDFSWFVNDVEEDKIPMVPEITASYAGTGLNLTSTWSLANHGHFLVDALSRFQIFLKAGYTLNDADYIYCTEPFHDFHRLLIEKLGLKQKKIIYAGKTGRVKFDLLLAPSFPGIKSLHAPWIPDFMRTNFLDGPGSHKKRRIYLTRKGYSRQIKNEAEFHRLLQKFDFEIIDPLQVAYQHILFSEAGIILSSNGSSLANIVFCRPGTKIIDLMPDDHINSFTYSLADAAGLEYHCILCRSQFNRPAGSKGPSYYDFYVDLDLLHEALSSICEC
jgi:hypothetical protein